jgi:hypothetical protein
VFGGRNKLHVNLLQTNSCSYDTLFIIQYDAKINPEGLLYDCGVEFSPDGKYGRQDYMKHASRGTYTLHSLYLLLWSNFGAFCVALLTQPDSDDKIHGNLISDWISVRHYCVSQLRTLWMHMRNNLNLSEEERTFFVMRAMKKFYEVHHYLHVCYSYYMYIYMTLYNIYFTGKDTWIAAAKCRIQHHTKIVLGGTCIFLMHVHVHVHVINNTRN